MRQILHSKTTEIAYHSTTTCCQNCDLSNHLLHANGQIVIQDSCYFKANARKSPPRTISRKKKNCPARTLSFISYFRRLRIWMMTNLDRMSQHGISFGQAHSPIASECLCRRKMYIPYKCHFTQEHILLIHLHTF